MFMKRFEHLKSLLQSCVFTTDKGSMTAHEVLENFYAYLRRVQEEQGIVYVVGNGGSAGIASHFCNDLLKTLKIPAQSLYDSNVLTCFSNDYGYDHVFSGPLNILIKPQDLLIAISSSGKSPNILNAASVAREKLAHVITLSGFSKDNPLREMGHLNFWLPSTDYGLVESGHFCLLHTVVDLWRSFNTFSPVAAYAEKN